MSDQPPRPSSFSMIGGDDRTRVSRVDPVAIKPTRQTTETQGDDQPTATEPAPATRQLANPMEPAGDLARKPPTIGSVLKERFVLQEILGAGGMGVVYKALDLRAQEAHDRDPYVAIKVLNQELVGDPQFLIALQRETKRAKILSHPHIINVYDFDRDGSHVFMTMEYLRGKPLNAYVKGQAEGRLRTKKAWPIIRDMGSALAYAHQKKIVHSDFKPGNVFIGEHDEVRVLDFGIACVLGPKDAEAGEATLYDSRSLGALSPAYASLEMLEGKEPDPRDDIYALACVSYEILAGKHPFARLTAQQALDLNLHPQRIPGVSARQWRALLHALALKQVDRTGSVEEFLREFQPGSAAAWFVGAGLAGFALLATAIAVWWFHQPSVVPPATMEPAQRVAPPSDADTEIRIDHPYTHPRSPEGANRVESADGNLVIWTTSASYRIGEELSVRFSVAKPLHVTILHTSAAAETATLFPNEYAPDQVFQPGVEYRMPAEDAKFTLNVAGPPGFDTITLVASDRPIPTDEPILNPDGRLTEEAARRFPSRAQLRYAVHD